MSGVIFVNINNLAQIFIQMKNVDQLPQRVGSILNSTQQLRKLKVLIVGVGGIGCQLLKVLCKMPIGSIDIIDMDTIQISNLNRQFLFKAEHKGQSKALIAKQTVKKLNPHLNIEAHHKNIRDFPISFFKRFNYLIMALDNIQTRNYVNKIGVRLGIPTIDAGTLGFKGNVHIIIPHSTRCYSCQPKVTSQKSFPVCTIRMRPEKPIHCAVWAKMLFEVLFSGQQVNNDMKDLANLAISGNQNSLLKQLLYTQINNIKNAKTESDSLLAQQYIHKIKPFSLEALSYKQNIKIQDFEAFDSNKLQANTLINLAKISFVKLLEQKQREGSVLFQKDDDLIIHFISSFANLRMMCFSIPQQSFNEVKNMAGNIVPAIASTNSIVSGLQVIQMIKLLSSSTSNLRSYYVQNQSYKVRALKTQLPLPQCQVCSLRARPVTFQVNMKLANFKSVIQKLKENFRQYDIEVEYSINIGSKELYNSQQPNKKILEKRLLEISEGAYEMDLIISDEDSSEKIFTLWVIHNQQCSSPLLINSDQIKMNFMKNAQERKVKQSQEIKERKVEQDSDDCGIVEVNNGQDPESSDDLVIVEVKKGNKILDENKDNEQIEDKVQKRPKL